MVKEKNAEDVLQASFIDVFNNLGSFNYQSTPGAWIKRIVINNCINHIRKRKLEVVSIEDQHHIEEPTETYQEAELDIQPIKEAIEKLPDGYRIIFNLYALEGYDHKEIAQVMNITEATSKSQYHRAKKKLKEIVVWKKTN